MKLRLLDPRSAQTSNCAGYLEWRTRAMHNEKHQSQSENSESCRTHDKSKDIILYLRSQFCKHELAYRQIDVYKKPRQIFIPVELEIIAVSSQRVQQ